MLNQFVVVGKFAGFVGEDGLVLKVVREDVEDDTYFLEFKMEEKTYDHFSLGQPIGVRGKLTPEGPLVRSISVLNGICE